MNYKVTNLSEAPIKVKTKKGDIIFTSRETKILEENPNSECFHVEEIEKMEKKQPKGGK